MKLTYLGTAAAEGFPAVFCNCAYCNRARELGGKNIRTRSQSLINDDLLLDLPADTYSHFLQNGISGDMVRYLLITHSHLDHFYPAELEMRHGAFARNMRVPQLQIFCGRGAYDQLQAVIGAQQGISATLVRAYEKICVGNYEVIPLPARHFAGDDAMIYVIRGEKTVLYAHDTGYLYDEVLDYIEKEQLYFNLISLDCTNVDIPIADTGSHMGLENIGRLLEKLSEIHAIDEKTVKYINHFSHNANPIQSVLEDRVKDMNLLVSYDGLQVEL